MNLLVIEDDRKLNRMLCEILEKEGYTVKACTDGEEGAYYLQQNAYDLALVDWMLPGESGPDILRESRRKGIMTPVVMLTALTAVENKVTCLDAGADDYLGKPFDSRELLARVRTGSGGSVGPSGWRYCGSAPGHTASFQSGRTGRPGRGRPGHLPAGRML